MKRLDKNQMLELLMRCQEGRATCMYVLEKIEEGQDELIDLLTSARAIAERRGVDTAWERFSARLAEAGIGSITAKVFKVLQSDKELKSPCGMDEAPSGSGLGHLGSSLPAGIAGDPPDHLWPDAYGACPVCGGLGTLTVPPQPTVKCPDCEGSGIQANP